MDQKREATPATVGALSSAMTLITAKLTAHVDPDEQIHLLTDLLSENHPFYVISAMLNIFEDILNFREAHPEVPREQLLEQFRKVVMSIEATVPAPEKQPFNPMSLVVLSEARYLDE